MADEETPDETPETEAEQGTEAEPATAEPEAGAEPQAAEPQAAEPQAAEPEAAEPEAAEPEAAEPEAAEEPATESVPPAATEPAAEAPSPPAPKQKRKRLPRAQRHKHSKPERQPSATRKPIIRTPKSESVTGRRQERRGIVVSDKGDKTIVVQIETVRIHAKYKKVVRRSNKLHAHDEGNTAGIGDTVRVVETRPLSK